VSALRWLDLARHSPLAHTFASPEDDAHGPAPGHCIVDDVTGDELEGGETVNFALEEVEYQIDLSEEHADELRKAFAPYVLKGRRIGGRYARGGDGSARKSRRSANSASSGASGRSKRDRQAIRDWLLIH
jgi:hypothetical protein